VRSGRAAEIMPGRRAAGGGRKTGSKDKELRRRPQASDQKLERNAEKQTGREAEKIKSQQEGCASDFFRC